MCIVTGSVSMVRTCEVNASVASPTNMSELTALYSTLCPGRMITHSTTNTAYRIRNHVNITQIIPQMSYNIQTTYAFKSNHQKKKPKNVPYIA